MTAQLRQVSDRCPTCGGRPMTPERENAEIALANIMTLMKRPGGLALLEQVLRHLQGMKSGAVRMLAQEEEEAALRRTGG